MKRGFLLLALAVWAGVASAQTKPPATLPDGLQATGPVSLGTSSNPVATNVWGTINLNGAPLSASLSPTTLGLPGGPGILNAEGVFPASEIPNETPDQLAGAVANSLSDEVLCRQSGLVILRCSLNALNSFLLSNYNAAPAPVLMITAPGTISASANRSLVVATGSGTLTLSQSATSDGFATTIVNAGSGVITLAGGSGSTLLTSTSGGTNLLPGITARVERFSIGGVTNFVISGPSSTAQLSLNYVPGALASSTIFVSGLYANYTPSSLDYTINGGTTWITATSPTISGGAFSFTFTGPSGAGTYSLSVRDHTNNSVFAQSSFVVSSAAQIVVNTPPNVFLGGTVPITGTYIGSPPALQAAFDGLSNYQVIVNSPSGGQFSGTLPAPSAGMHTVTVEASDSSAVSAASGAFTVVGVPTITAATPANVALGYPVTVAGTYTYDTPPGIDCEFASADGLATVSWSTCTSGAPTGGAYSFNVQGLGNHYWSGQVRLTDNPSITASVGYFAVGNAIQAGISPATPVGGSTITISGLVSYNASKMIWTFLGESNGETLGFYSGSIAAGGSYSGTIEAPAAAGTYTIKILDGSYIASTTISVTTTAPTSAAISPIPPVFSQVRTDGMTLTGYYGGYTPTALDYSPDGTNWFSDGTFSSNGQGKWTLVIPAQTANISAGYRQMLVRDHTQTGVQCSFGNIDWTS